MLQRHRGGGLRTAVRCVTDQVTPAVRANSPNHNRLTGGIEAYYHRIAFVEADADGAKGIAEMCDENGIRACLNVRFDKLAKVAASVVHRAVGLGPVAHEIGRAECRDRVCQYE